MSQVTEVFRDIGSWEITFDGLPRTLSDAAVEGGHIVITTVRALLPATDDLLPAARYTGVITRRTGEAGDTALTLRGGGLAWWLGEPGGTFGPVLPTPVAFTATPLDVVVSQLLPSSIKLGTITSSADTYTGAHQNQTPRTAIDYVCDTLGRDWRIRPDARIDVGADVNLFGGSPRVVVVRRDAGDDVGLRGVVGDMALQRDIEDYTTEAWVVKTDADTTTILGQAALDPAQVPYLDMFGAPLRRVKLVSETDTTVQNGPARAQYHLRNAAGVQRAVTLSSLDYEIDGVVGAGDYVWVHDPDVGLFDPANEIIFRGERMNPTKERVTSVTWPIAADMGVYYRSGGGAWLDLSDWVEPDTRETTIEVGKYARPLTSG